MARNKIRAPRITMPKRSSPSTAPDGSLGGAMGMNVGTGLSEEARQGMLAYSQSISLQSRAIPQRGVNALGLTMYGNPFWQNAFKFLTPGQGMPLSGRGNVPSPPQPGTPNFDAAIQSLVNRNETSLFSNTPSTPSQATRPKDNSNTVPNYNARLQQVIDGGARPAVLTLADAVRLSPGFSVEDVKSQFLELGYEYVPTSQGGLLRQTGTTPGNGTPIGNSPGAGYTWSNGAWHAPAGEDPYSDIKSVKMGKKRGWVTPEVANLLARKRRRRIQEAFESGTHPTQIRAQAAAVATTPTGGGDIHGLVNFGATFG